MNGEYAHKDIANLFSCQYKSLYSSVTSDLSELSHMYDSIQADINNVCLSNNHSCGSFYDHTVYRINVVNAIRSLCAGKSDGVNDICSDNLKHATDRFIDYIVSLFNSILSHGCILISCVSPSIIPIQQSQDTFLFNDHCEQVTNRVSKRNSVLKALAGTNWGQQKETLLLTYKALGRSIANYAAPVWNTNASDTSLEKIQRTQN